MPNPLSRLEFSSLAGLAKIFHRDKNPLDTWKMAKRKHFRARFKGRYQQRRAARPSDQSRRLSKGLPKE
jgi:hypothetical protein